MVWEITEMPNVMEFWNEYIIKSQTYEINNVRYNDTIPKMVYLVLLILSR